MKYKCKNCDETYPHEPAVCNDCGVRFNLTNFVCVDDTAETWTDVVDRYKRETGASVFASSKFESWLKEHYEQPTRLLRIEGK